MVLQCLMYVEVDFWKRETAEMFLAKTSPSSSDISKFPLREGGISFSSTKNDGKLVNVCYIRGRKLVRGSYETGRKNLQQGKLKSQGEIVDRDTLIY